MADTVTSADQGGGGPEAPLAPPGYDDDPWWERRVVEAANDALRSRLDKNAPHLAYLSLKTSVFDISQPVSSSTMPFGRERRSRYYSPN